MPKSGRAIVDFTQGGIALPASSGSFPTGQPDGYLHTFLADTTNGVAWQFRWRSAASKWEFVGGPPLLKRVDTSESKSTTGYGDLTTTGPSVTLPLSGDYEIEYGCNMASASNAENIARASLLVNAVAPADAQAAMWALIASAATQGASVMTKRVMTGMIANDVLKLQYSLAAGNAVSFAQRFLSVRPIRVS